MNSAEMTEILIKRSGKICTVSDLKKIFEKRYSQIRSRLINGRWIKPLLLFDGIYYVCDPEERAYKSYKLSRFEVLVAVLNKSLKNWYFGRITALHHLNGTQQASSAYYVINNKYSMKIKSKFFGEIVFTKISVVNTYGLIKIRYGNLEYFLSSMERTLTDYLYLYNSGAIKKEYILKLFKENKYSRKKLQKTIVKCYPKASAIKMFSVIGEIK
ncbi:MAG: hypothetical protein WC356_05235 [Candidatus Micrarchaeia archaeon]|jgi:hypothetical protein